MAGRCPFLAQLEQMPRLTEARYADGLGTLYEQTDPVEVARKVFDQDGDIPNSEGLSTLFTTWGQFLDHDLSLTPEGENGEEVHIDAFHHGIGRSGAMDGTGETGAREFGNAITWAIDGSQIYGSNADREEDVRSFEGGKLKMIDDPTSTHGLLPLATPETVMAGDTDGEDAVFLAGDIRASENPNLLSLHTLFAREHNYWAEKLAAEHPDWSDQDLFEVARSIVEYEMQKITYDEWLPHLIGNALPDEIDHDPDVSGQISLEFSTAAFRFGHTMVSGHMPRLNEDGSVFGDGHLELLDNFFNPEAVKTGGIDALLRGQSALHAQEVDTKVIDDLNFFLATPDGVSGFSLPALNLIRGADHGMGSYLEVRAQLLGDVDLSTLDPQDFSIITSDPDVQAELASVYDTVLDVDLWVGGLAEDKIEGTQTGPLFHHILSDQFYRTAAADQSFGELDPRIGPELLAQIQVSGLREVILRNTDIDTLQDDPFLTAPRELSFEALIVGTDGDDVIDLAAIAAGHGIETGAGDDTITITGGSTVPGKINMGDGADRLIMSSGETRFDVDMGRGKFNEVVTLSGTAKVGDDLHTGDGNDVVRMTDMALVADDVVTRGGQDQIELSGKATIGGTIDAGAADDRISLTENVRAGEIDAGAGDDVILLLDDALADEINGGAGLDILALHDRPFRIDADGEDSGRIVFLDGDGNETGESVAYTGIEIIGGTEETGEEDDVFVGLNSADEAYGQEGDDTLAGLDGADRLSGGRGDDLVLGGRGDDRLRGDAGDDQVQGGAGNDRVAGNSGDDILGGDNGDDTVLGASGNDTLQGGAGDDRITAGTGDDVSFGNSGNDVLNLGGGNDRGFGGSGDDTINGGLGDDALRGGGGNDVLAGGGGTDTLTGGEGDDVFALSTSHDGMATITDYSGGDLLALAKLSEEEVIEILTGQGSGNDVILTSSENENWRVIIEDVEDFDEDHLSYL